MITSTQNSKVKQIRQLQSQAKIRKAEHAFVVEGVRLCEEALAANWDIRFGLCSPDLSPRGQNMVESLTASGIPIEMAAENVIKAVSDTKTPQGIVLVLDAKALPLPKNPEFVLVIDQINNPGNLGTLIRTASAAGIEAVLVSEGSADIFSPKVVRSGMGAHFRLPITMLSSEEIISVCQSWGVQLWASMIDQGIVYTQAPLDKPAALIIGSEAQGVDNHLRQAAKPIHIPMPGGSESLNAAAAGAILIFEAVRQRSDRS